MHRNNNILDRMTYNNTINTDINNITQTNMNNIMDIDNICDVNAANESPYTAATIASNHYKQNEMMNKTQKQNQLNIGTKYVPNNKIIPIDITPANIIHIKPNQPVDISLKSKNVSFLPRLLKAIEKNVTFGIPGKYTYRIDKKLVMHLWISKNEIKYQKWQKDLNISIPLLDTALQYIKWYDFGNTNNNLLHDLVASLFDVPPETKSRFWYIASIKNSDSSHDENSMQWVLRAQSQGHKFTLSNCTGYCWCGKCPMKIRRTPQKTRINQTINPFCTNHRNPIRKIKQQCYYFKLVIDNESVTKDKDFCRLVVRFGYHALKCETLKMKPKQSAVKWYFRNRHVQDRSGNESISVRYFDHQNMQGFQIKNIDPCLKDKNKIKNMTHTHKKLVRAQQGVTGKFSSYTDWRFLGGGAPEILKHNVVYYEIDDEKNKMIVLTNKQIVEKLVDEINQKRLEKWYDTDDIQKILAEKIQFLHQQMPLHVCMDCTHNKITHGKTKKIQLLDMTTYMEMIRTSLGIIYNITLREDIPAYIAMFGSLIESMLEFDICPPLPTICRAVLVTTDLDASMAPSILLSINLLFTGKWKSVKEQGIEKWFNKLATDESTTLQSIALQFLRKHGINSPVVRDRIHAMTMGKRICRLLPSNTRGDFVASLFRISQSNTTKIAADRVKKFVLKFDKYPSLNGKMKIFTQKNTLKRCFNWMTHIEPDAILRALQNDDDLDVERNHEDINCVFDRTSPNIYDACVLLKGQLERDFGMYYDNETYVVKEQRDLTHIRYMRTLERLDKATTSSYVKGSMEKYHSNMHQMKKSKLKQIDITSRAEIECSIGKELKLKHWNVICKSTQATNVLFIGNCIKRGFMLNYRVLIFFVVLLLVLSGMKMLVLLIV
eukprot:402066_1